MNGIAVMHPTGEIPFDDVCKKDVPAGVPYLIIDDSDIPTDREFRAAWEADFTNPDGYGIGQEAWRSRDEVNRLREYIDAKKAESLDHKNEQMIAARNAEIEKLEAEYIEKNNIAIEKMAAAQLLIDEAKKIYG